MASEFGNITANRDAPGLYIFRAARYAHQEITPFNAFNVENVKPTHNNSDYGSNTFINRIYL